MKGVFSVFLTLAIPLLVFATPYTQIGYETYETPDWVENYVDWTRTSSGGTVALYYAHEVNTPMLGGIYGFQWFAATGEMQLEWTEDFTDDDYWPFTLCELPDGNIAIFFREVGLESIEIRMFNPTGTELDPLTVDIGYPWRDLQAHPIPQSAGGGLMLLVRPHSGDYWRLVRLTDDYEVVYDVGTALEDGKTVVLHSLGDGVLGMFGYNEGPSLYRAAFADGSPVGFNRFAAEPYDHFYLAERLTPNLFATVFATNDGLQRTLKLVRANGTPVVGVELDGIDHVVGVYPNGEGGILVLGHEETHPALTRATILQSFDNQGTKLWAQYVDLGFELPVMTYDSNSTRPLDAWRLPNGQLVVMALREIMPPDPSVVWPYTRDIAFHRMGEDNTRPAVIDLNLQYEARNGQRLDVEEIPLTIWNNLSEQTVANIWFDWVWTMEDPNDPFAIPWLTHSTELPQVIVLNPGEVYFDPEFEYIIPDLPDNAASHHLAIRYNVGHYPDEIWASDYFKTRIYEYGPTGETDTAFGTNDLPESFALSQIYPNPFNPTTTIGVVLPRNADLSITVHDVLGRQVARLAQGQLNAGYHAFEFDGSTLASGVYFVHAIVPGEMNTVQKVVLMK